MRGEKVGRPPRGGRPWRRELCGELRFQRRRCPEPERLADLVLQLEQRGLVFLQPLLGVLTALPDALVLVRVPGAGLLDDALLDAGVENGAGLGDALAVDD